MAASVILACVHAPQRCPWGAVGGAAFKRKAPSNGHPSRGTRGCKGACGLTLLFEKGSLALVVEGVVARRREWSVSSVNTFLNLTQHRAALCIPCGDAHTDTIGLGVGAMGVPVGGESDSGGSLRGIRVRCVLGDAGSDEPSDEACRVYRERAALLGAFVVDAGEAGAGARKREAAGMDYTDVLVASSAVGPAFMVGGTVVVGHRVRGGAWRPVARPRVACMLCMLSCKPARRVRPQPSQTSPTHLPYPSSSPRTSSGRPTPLHSPRRPPCWRACRGQRSSRLPGWTSARRAAGGSASTRSGCARSRASRCAVVVADECSIAPEGARAV
jgi:hypothetical protein